MIPGKFLCMLVQNGCLDSQQVPVFAHVKKSVFTNRQDMQFLGPKNGGPFLNLLFLAPVKFSLKMVRGTKNGAQKWDPKMVSPKMKKCWQKHREIIAGKLLHLHAIPTLDCISSSAIGARANDDAKCIPKFSEH